jgi:catechol 2,3-dioxygenase-like lactoylglutathione lyase family enzyme
MTADARSEAPGLTCTVHSVSVQTARFDEAYRFYAEILGLRVVREPFPFKSRTLAWLDAGSILVELYSVRKEDTPKPYTNDIVGPDHIAFVVDDLDAMVERLKDHDVRILKGPMKPPSGDPRQPRVLFAEGPDGDEIQFREHESG